MLPKKIFLTKNSNLMFAHVYYHVYPSALEDFLKCNVKFTKLDWKGFPSVLSGFPIVLSSLSKCTVRFALYTVVDKCTECVSGDRGMLF